MKLFITPLMLIILFAGHAAAQPVQLSGAQARKPLMEAGAAFVSLYGAPSASDSKQAQHQILERYDNSLKHHEPIRGSRSRQSDRGISVQPTYQAGHSTYRIKFSTMLQPDGEFASKIGFNPVTGHGRLRASERRIDRRNGHKSTYKAGALINRQRGKQVFLIEGTSGQYTARVFDEETVRARPVTGMINRSRARRQISVLPRSLATAILNGQSISIVRERTRTTKIPCPSLAKELRPPTRTERSVKIWYKVPTRYGHASGMISSATLRSLRKAAAGSRR